MKRSDLEKKLREIGCIFYKHGGSHDKFKTKSGKIIMVPRHREINELTAKGILRDAKS